MSKIDLAAENYQLGRFTVNCCALTVNNGDKSVKLPVKVFELLKLFVANNNHTITRDEAIKIIWNENIAVGERGFTNAMWHLRKAFTDLGAEPEEVFKTLRKVGYTLVIKPSVIVAENDDISADIQAIEHFNVSRKLAFSIALTVLVVFIAVYALILPLLTSNEQIQYVSEINKITNFQGIEEQPAISHSGRYLVFRWRQEKGTGRLFIKDLIDADAPLRQLSRSSSEEKSPVWSPDDKRIAYLRLEKSGSCQVRIISRATIEDEIVDTDCVNTSSRHGLDWSPDSKYLLYTKKQGNTLALFKYNVENNRVVQVSFPQNDERDVQAVWSANSQDIALIRLTNNKNKLLLLHRDGTEQILLDDKVEINGLAWDHAHNQIYTSTNLLDKSYTGIHRLDVVDDKWQVVNHIVNVSNIAVNPLSGEVFYSQFTSGEYIVQRNFQDNNIIRKISSSSRDMYGSYARETEEILFLSNRAGNWDLWFKSANYTKNLTKDFGVVTSMPVAAPKSTKFVIMLIMKDDQSESLVIGDSLSGRLQTIDTGGLAPTNPQWSWDGTAILFIASKEGKASVYKYNVASETITLISSANEKFVIEGGDGMLYSSRRWQEGIWQFDPKTKQSSQIIDDLHPTDYGAFFWLNDAVIYLARSKTEDIIKRVNLDNTTTDTRIEVITSYPSNTIRQYSGISAANDNSFLVTLNGMNDADINSVQIYPISD